MAAAEAHAPTAGEYIIHHLTHLQNAKPRAVADFAVFNVDSIFYAVLLGVAGSWLLWRAARSVTSGVPGRFQAAIEILVEMVDGRSGRGRRGRRTGASWSACSRRA